MVYILFKFFVLYNDIYNVFRGETVPSREKQQPQQQQQQQSIGIKPFYLNVSYGLKHAKTASVIYLLKCS